VAFIIVGYLAVAFIIVGYLAFRFSGFSCPHIGSFVRYGSPKPSNDDN
jgi:hypothetical protein